MARRGRPPIPKAEQKKITLSVRFTPAQKKLIDAAARAAKVQLSAWARGALLAAAVAKREPEIA